MNQQDRSDKYSAPALFRGLDILERLACEPESQKKADIARALNRSISEIFRMLVVLEERQYVAFDQHSERYSLTTKLFEDISAPIQDHAGHVIAAVTIPFIRRLNSGNHSTQAQTRKALITMSKNVSHLVGGDVWLTVDLIE